MIYILTMNRIDPHSHEPKWSQYPSSPHEEDPSLVLLQQLPSIFLGLLFSWCLLFCRFRLFFFRLCRMVSGHHHVAFLLLPSIIFLLDGLLAAAAAVPLSYSCCCGLLEPSSDKTSFSSAVNHWSTTANERPIMAAVPTSRSNDWVVEMLLLFTIC